jgi:hypothetical protein
VNDWQFSDAWFATAVAWCGGRDLSHVIGAADALNHDILTRHDIQQAVGRLVGSGVLAVRGDRFMLTESGEALLKQRRGRAIEQAESVLDLLMTVPLRDAGWALTEEEWRSAYEAYVQRIEGPSRLGSWFRRLFSPRQE